MKKKLLVILALVLTCSMILTACGGGGSSSTSEGGGDAPASSDEKIPFDVAVTLGEPVSPNWAKVINEIAERSGGKFVPTIYWSGSLISIPEIPKSMATGAAAFANLPSPNYPDVLPLNCTIMQMPFMGLQDPEVSCEIYMQLYNEFPEMQEEMAAYNMKVLGATPLGTYGMHFTDTNEVRKPSDLNGRKIVPYSMPFLPLLEANNAAGSYIPPGQIYESLEKGVVDGYINNWAFQGWFALSDLMKQHVEFTEYGAFQEFNILVVNMDFWDSLTPEDQQLWEDVIWNEGGYKQMWQDTKDLVANEKKKGEEKGDLFVELTDEEIKVWEEGVTPEKQPIIEAANTARGDDAAQRIYDRTLELIAEKTS